MTNTGDNTCDSLTIAALSIVAYSLVSIVHEALGHGLACLLVGVEPKELTSISFNVDWENVSAANVRIIGAAGTVANLVAGFVFFSLLRSAKSISPHLRYFCWLSMTLNFLHGSGYLLMVWFFGDWKYVVMGLEPLIAWKFGLTIIGAALYFCLGMVLAARYLEPFLGQYATRVVRARRLTWLPYLVGSSITSAAALFNPGGAGMSAIAAAEWFGGTSLLLFLPFVVEKPKQNIEPLLSVRRSWLWISVGSVCLVIFIFILGRGITFSR